MFEANELHRRNRRVEWGFKALFFTMTILLVTNLVQQARRLASRTLFLWNGEIIELDQKTKGEFIISGKRQWWKAVFTNRIDPFLATQQGKLQLKRGELAKLSQWYKPFQRAFSIWQTIPVQ